MQAERLTCTHDCPQVLSGLTQGELAALNAFEAEEYALRDVQVQVNGVLQDSAAYVWRDEHRYEGRCMCTNWTPNTRHLLLGEPWSYEQFRERHLPEYVDMCTRWATQ